MESKNIKISNKKYLSIVKILYTCYNKNIIVKTIEKLSQMNDKEKNTVVKTNKNEVIKLVIDLHGSKKSRDFDIEFGTVNNLSANFSTIKELEKLIKSFENFIKQDKEHINKR